MHNYHSAILFILFLIQILTKGHIAQGILIVEDYLDVTEICQSCTD